MALENDTKNFGYGGMAPKTAICRNSWGMLNVWFGQFLGFSVGALQQGNPWQWWINSWVLFCDEFYPVDACLESVWGFERRTFYVGFWRAKSILACQEVLK
jgi:hypothetical protein